MLTKQELFSIFQSLYEKKKQPITLEEVCTVVDCCPKTLRKNMRIVNAYEDCPDVFKCVHKTLHCFDTITQQSAYWIGYLMADGCLTSSRGVEKARLMLECKADDKEILVHFCEFAQIRQERITIGHQGASCALSLANSNFSTSVERYGIQQDKSHLENHIYSEILQNDEYFFQFLKGLIDGDGTIHTSSTSRGVSIVSNSQLLLNEIKEKLQNTLPCPSSVWIITRQAETIHRTQNLYTLKIGTGKQRENLKFLYDKFYLTTPIILKRKEQLLKSLLQ